MTLCFGGSEPGRVVEVLGSMVRRRSNALRRAAPSRRLHHLRLRHPISSAFTASFAATTPTADERSTFTHAALSLDR